MAFIPSPGVFRIAIEGDASGNPIVNVFHVKPPAGPSGPPIADVAITARDAWTANILPLLNAAYTLRRIRVTDLSASDAAVEVLPVTGQTGQNSGSDTYALGAAVVGTIYTAARGRSARGRMYFAPISEGDAVAGRLSTERLTQWATALASFRTDWATDGLNLGVLSQYTNGAPRTAGLFRPSISFVVRNADVGSQDRRQGRK